VRKRIVTLTLAAALLAISLFGLPLAAWVAKYYLDDERVEVERVTDAAALSIADTLAAVPRSVHLPATGSDTALGVYTPGGSLLTGQGPPAADEVVRHADQGNPAQDDVDGNLVFATPVTDNGVVIGVVRATSPRLEVYPRIGLTWLAMLGLAAAALTLTWLMARRMAARLAYPLEKLAQTARQLGEGDFTVRAPFAHVPEIDLLGYSLDTTAERIGEMLDRERAFSANASHQLRTPLAGLRLQLEAALDTPNADARAALRSGIDTADRLERTITDLLTLARDTGSPGETADPTDLLTEIQHCWQTLLTAQDRSLHVVSDSPPAPRASAAAIRQILAVLLDNAITHGQGTVTVTARDAGNALAVDVSDQGPGIEGHPEVFARRRHSGTGTGPVIDTDTDTAAGQGIGLALARTLAEAEGGRLWLSQPAPPTFTLLLPADPRSS